MIVRDSKIDFLDEQNSLSEDDKKRLFCHEIYLDDFIKKDNKLYHRRNNEIKVLVNELLGELIAEYFKIDTVKSDMYITPYLKHRYSLLTEVFTKSDEEYYYMDDLFPDVTETRGLLNLDYLKKICINDKEKKTDKKFLKKILYKLKKMIVLDYIINNTDRSFLNFIFKNNDLMPLFDYEFSFDSNVLDGANALYFYLDDKKVRKYFRKDDDFQKLFEKAMKLDMKKIFNKLSSEYPIYLSSNEKWDYENVIKYKQNEIKEYKLLT